MKSREFAQKSGICTRKAEYAQHKIAEFSLSKHVELCIGRWNLHKKVESAQEAEFAQKAEFAQMRK